MTGRSSGAFSCGGLTIGLRAARVMKNWRPGARLSVLPGRAAPGMIAARRRRSSLVLDRPAPHGFERIEPDETKGHPRVPREWGLPPPRAHASGTADPYFWMLRT